MRFSNAELGLMKSVFAENKDLLKSLRKFFLEMELNETEKSFFGQLKSREVVNLIEKCFSPKLDGNAPFHQIIDLWMTVKIDGQDPEIANLNLASRDIVIRYMDKKVAELRDMEDNSGITFKALSFNKLNSAEDNYIFITARNTIVGHVEMQLNQLFILAGKKNEDVEETMRELEKKNSAK